MDRRELKRWIRRRTHGVLLLLPASCSVLMLAIGLPGRELRIILIALWLLSAAVVLGLVVQVLLRLRHEAARELAERVRNR